MESDALLSLFVREGVLLDDLHDATEVVLVQVLVLRQDVESFLTEHLRHDEVHRGVRTFFGLELQVLEGNTSADLLREGVNDVVYFEYLDAINDRVLWKLTRAKLDQVVLRCHVFSLFYAPAVSKMIMIEGYGTPHPSIIPCRNQ